jgi:steroid 5-alpha reductase family enzyme
MSDFLPSLGIGAITAFMVFTLTWLLSRKLDNYSLVDITWSYSLALLVPLYAWMIQGQPLRSAVTVAIATLWSLRLGTYLLLRIKKHHPQEDVRYQVLRQKWSGYLGSRFFMFFQAQALLIILLSIPFLLVLLNPSPHLASMEYFGIAVWFIGITGESIADAQMQRFKSDPANKGKICDIGLWHYSRHPNYFFESVLWFGFWLYACGSPWGWLTVYAPLLILHFLVRVTGIPLTEKCAVTSKGDAYRSYQRRTSAFIPWFPKKTS